MDAFYEHCQSVTKSQIHFRCHRTPFGVYIETAELSQWEKGKLSGRMCVNHSGMKKIEGTEGKEEVDKMKSRSARGKKQ